MEHLVHYLWWWREQVRLARPHPHAHGHINLNSYPDADHHANKHLDAHGHAD
jgi:hypothetical protein